MIANLQQTSVAPAVKRAAASLSSGFIAPAAGGRTADLADRQTAVVGKVESSIAAQAASLSDAADKILAMPRVEPARFQTMSPAEAVLRYAGDFIPSWAGAISIDLMPAVLVLILCVVHAAIRREGLPAFSASEMTAGELVAALQMAREVEEARRVAPAEAGRSLLPRRPRPSRGRGRRERHLAVVGAAHQIGRRHAAIGHNPAARSCFSCGQSGRGGPALDFPQRRRRHDRRARGRPRRHERMDRRDRIRQPRYRHDTPSPDLPDIVPSVLAPLRPGRRQAADAAAASRMARWQSR